MSDNNLVPVPDGGRKAANRRSRMQRRERALAQREDNAVPADQEDTSARSPDVVRPDAFVLPPRAELEKSSTLFGRFVKWSFILLVAAPTLIAALFYAFVASDQYATQSAFAVRGSSGGASALDLGGLFSLGSGAVDAETSDSYIVQEYIHSREMVEALIAEANFIEVYSRPSADPYYRLDPAGTIEDFVDYWRTMSLVEFDTETGIMQLTVRAFRPQDAETITQTVIERSEDLVNELSLRAREDSLKNARREVEIAEKRYAEARRAVASYRGSEREIDPSALATSRQTLVGELEAEVARRESELSALRATMSENSPRVVYVRNQIDALKKQISNVREQVAEPEDGQDRPVLTERLSRFEELLAEREFAQKAYVSSLAALESARVEALKQQRYLAVFVRGTAPEAATYPEGMRWTLILFGSLFMGWGVLCLVSAALRDRVV
jgi:capsular polysaccharide transport system permease protein